MASLLGATAVVVAALGILRWQADTAAADYVDRAQANLKTSTAESKKDPVFKSATERLAAAKKATASEPLARRAQVVGSAITALLKVSATTLRAEHAGVPHLKSVPLGSRLSGSYRDAKEKSAKIDKMYDQLERLTGEAVAFYPSYGKAVENAVSSAFASWEFPLSSMLSSAQRMKTNFSGDAYADGLKSIADRRATLERLSSMIKETPLIPATETRRKAILSHIDEQFAACEVARQGLEARDQKSVQKAIDVMDRGSKNDYSDDFIALVNESGDIGNDVSALAEKLTAAIEDL